MPATAKIVWYPLLVAIFMLLAVVVSYLVASNLGHVYSIWPYISDSGVQYPESNIFAQFLNIAAFFGIVSIYLRYLGLISTEEHVHRYLRLSAAVIGIISSASLTMVGNFQENHADRIHFLGAALMFGLGTVYTVLDTLISIKIRDNIKNGKLLAKIRIVLASASIVFSLLFIIGKLISEHRWDADHDAHQHWNPSDPEYGVHLMGSISEWLVGLMFVSYFLTLSWEFHGYEMSLKVEGRKDRVNPEDREDREDRESRESREILSDRLSDQPHNNYGSFSGSSNIGDQPTL